MRPKQESFTDAEFEKYRKRTRRDQFLSEMQAVVPWSELLKLIEPMYPPGTGAGRPPLGLKRMLRIHFLQHWFNLSDPAVEEALYDSRAMREFVGIDLGREAAPDESTVCRFRHLLEAYELGPQILATVNAHLAAQGYQVSTGTIVDATIISAPSSTKNREGKRDPEMHQTRQGNETEVWGDCAYQGQRDIIEAVSPNACDLTHRRYRYVGRVDKVQPRRNRVKSRTRARVEHAFLIPKRVFGFSMVRYRGPRKNRERLNVASALVNLFQLRRPLLRQT